MSKLACTLFGALTVVALAACSQDSQLVVQNQQSPDELRALARPTDVEGLVGSQFRVINNNTDGDVLNVNAQLTTMGMENFSTLANADMGPAGQIPRASVNNSRGNTSLVEKYNPYLALYRSARSVALALSRLNLPSFTFFPTNLSEVARDQAMGYFTMGVALGDIALVYDSGAVVAAADDPNKPAPPFVVHDSLMFVALAYLDTAIIYAGKWPTLSGFSTSGIGTMPDAWISTPTAGSLTPALITQLCHSYKARFMAGVARTPADRAAVNWTKVIAEAKAGVPSDFILQMTTSAPAWNYRPDQMDLYGSWHQMWQYMVGMADTSGAYKAYLATTPTGRAAFLVQTPDLRFPQGATRAAQNTYSNCAAGVCNAPTLGNYLRNRLSGLDAQGDPLGFSYYDFYRFGSFFTGSPARRGPIQVFTRSELNLLIAEADIYLGNIAEATQYIDSSRAKHGLIKLTGIVTNTTMAVPGQDGVSGSNSCVPQIPTSPFTTTKCGNLLEAMKWEKRMETAYTHWGAWWIDGRGWGDLPFNTPLQYPTPYQELDTRRLPSYTYSSGAGPGPGTYGL
jgi:hypothetical protein